MSFFALVNPLTGETVRVVRSFEEPLPDGLIAIELPAPGDDVSWLEGWRAGHGSGGGNGSTYLDRQDQKPSARAAAGVSSMLTPEQFFVRLEQEVTRAGDTNRRLSLLLFDLIPADRPQAQAFVIEMLQARGQELLPCDTVARVRPHLVAVILPDVDATGARFVPPRGSVTTLTFPEDRDAIDALRKRRHPLLQRSLHRLGGGRAA